MTSHTIRIIGGQWMRSKLPVANRPGLRPTPDRVRETLFNWLGQDLTGWRCVDAFAGTGVLGFEAASRGAADVLLVEQDPVHAAQIQSTQVRLAAHAVRVVVGNGIDTLWQQAPGSIDAVFLDPPFDATLLEAALQAAAQAVASTGYVYLEAGRRWDDTSLRATGLHVYRYLKAGIVHAHLLTPSHETTKLSPV